LFLGGAGGGGGGAGGGRLPVVRGGAWWRCRPLYSIVDISVSYSL